MREETLDKLLQEAQSGSSAAREELIRYHKSFLVNVTAKICQRHLTWENDDELSIALMALNDAIDRYNPGNKAKFYTFAHAVIRHRLVDWFRKESKHKNISLSPVDPEEELSTIDKRNSFEKYKQAQQEESFVQVVDSFNQTLTEYGISLADLVKVSPKHRDTRDMLVRAAQKLAEDAEMVEQLRRLRQLPIKKLMDSTGLSRRVLENGRKYIIATALITIRPEFINLKKFAQLTFKKNK